MYEFVHTSVTRTATRIRELDINGRDLELPRRNLVLVLSNGIGKVRRSNFRKITSRSLRRITLGFVDSLSVALQKLYACLVGNVRLISGDTNRNSN